MSKTTKWGLGDLPSQRGRTALVTGANSGLGLETSRALAGAGAKVVLACRNLEKAEEARADILRSHGDAQLEILPLDLASLASVREFARGFSETHERLDLLINNAGIMAIPRRSTDDGFEMQFGTNHLGHFALTGALLPKLLHTPDARVVTLSSTAHRFGRMRWDDLQGERFYVRWLAYGQSKLANLLFAFELARRFEEHGAGCVSVAAHPGFASTNLQYAGARMEGSSWKEAGMGLVNRIFSQSAEQGALPTLYAATADEAGNGDYFGPDGVGEMQGHPTKVGAISAAKNRDDARRLWEISEELTGAHYDWSA